MKQASALPHDMSLFDPRHALHSCFFLCFPSVVLLFMLFLVLCECTVPRMRRADPCPDADMCLSTCPIITTHHHVPIMHCRDAQRQVVARERVVPPYKQQTTAPQDYRDPVCPAFVSKIRDEVVANAMPLPNTSVIFCFCNEPQSSLYHSIHSVIDRSPRYVRFSPRCTRLNVSC